MLRYIEKERGEDRNSHYFLRLLIISDPAKEICRFCSWPDELWRPYWSSPDDGKEVDRWESHRYTDSHTFTNPLSLLYRFSSYQWEEGGDDSSMEKPQRTLRCSYQSTGNGKEDTCFQSWGWRYDPSNNSKWSKPITYYQWIIQKMINFYALLLQWTFCPIAALLHQWKFEPLK